VGCVFVCVGGGGGRVLVQDATKLSSMLVFQIDLLDTSCVLASWLLNVVRYINQL